MAFRRTVPASGRRRREMSPIMTTDLPPGVEAVSPGPSGSVRDGSAVTTPSCLSAFIIRVSAWGQLWLALLSVVAFAAGVAPLEFQRRIVNDAVVGGSAASIIWLAVAYAVLALALGLLKLAMNIYRGYLSEQAVRWLRASIFKDLRHLVPEGRLPETQGVKVSLVLNEAEPIGAFVGISISEPLLQGGLLLSVFGYMVYLNSLMAVVAFAVFTPQLVFVPLMQRAINRRVGTRIGVLRQISAGIIGEPGGGADAGSPQDGRIQSVFALNMGILELKFSMNFLMNMMHHLGLAAILALGGYYVVTGRTEIGTVVAFVSGLAQVNDPWSDLVNWYRDLKVTQTKYDLIVRALMMLRG
jgi:ABC-type bacteriocin/lantibiotic exporter with double-glycine peptidase domain